MKFLQVLTFYYPYLDLFAHNNPSLGFMSYDELLNELIEDGFASGHMFAKYIEDLGYETMTVIANWHTLQSQWLSENGFNYTEDTYEIVRLQIETFKPDVLYISDTVGFASNFIRTLNWKPSLILGWRAASISNILDWSEFDVMFSHMSYIRKEALKMGAKNSEFFYPGYAVELNKKLSKEPPKFDVVFSGQYTNDHIERNKMLLDVAMAPLSWGSEFTVGYYIQCASGKTEDLPAGIAMNNYGPKYALEMYNALKSGKIVINAHSDVGAKNEAGNLRLYETTGAGAFLLTDYKDNLSFYFEPGVELETYKDNKELIEKIRYYLDHEDEREAIAARGQEKCIREYSMQNRVKHLDELIKKYWNKKTKISKPANLKTTTKINRSSNVKMKTNYIKIDRSNLPLLSNEEAQKAMDKAVFMLKSGKNIDAAKYLDDLHDKYKIVKPGFHVLRGMALETVGRYEETFEASKLELLYDPENIGAQKRIKYYGERLIKPKKEKIPTEKRSWGSELPYDTIMSIQNATHNYIYKDVPMIKNPFDLALYSLLIWNVKPRTIIEIGSKSGGSALWFGDMLDSYGLDCHVYSLDIFRVKNVFHDRVTFMDADGRNLQKTLTEDFMKNLPRPLLVIEDADHSYQTCIGVLNFFHEYLQPGEFLVMEDGMTSDMAQDKTYNQGPHRALKEFLSNHIDEYEIDGEYCDYFGYNYTWATNGFLKKIDPSQKEEDEIQESSGIVQDFVKHIPSDLRKVNVVTLCTADFGGAGLAARRIHKGLNELGLKATMGVLQKRSEEKNVHVVPVTQLDDVVILKNENKNLENLDKLTLRWYSLYGSLKERPKGLEMFSDSYSIAELEDSEDVANADVVHMHWVSGMINYEKISEVFKGKTVVWTLHDMNPFTGGCHYNTGCEKYKDECGACPQLGSDIFEDASNESWKDKLQAYKEMNIKVVTPSNWLAERAKESKLFSNFSVNVIHNGIPLDVFKPYSKEELKNEYNISQDSKVILFGADSVLNTRKGFNFLIDALNILAKEGLNDKIVLSIFGNLPESADLEAQFKIIKNGYISDKDKLAEIYSFADVFVIPSLEDNLPNTAVESIACGTPVVGFKTGGIPDIVEHKKTGYLSEYKDAESLAEGIKWVIFNDNYSELSSNSRKKAIEDFELTKQAKKYYDLYISSLPKEIEIKTIEDLRKHDSEAREIIDEANLFLKNNKIGIAKILLNDLLTKYPQVDDLQSIDARIEYDLGNNKKAVLKYLKLAKSNPDNTTFTGNAAVILWSTGRIFDSLNYYQRILGNSDINTKHAINYIESLYSLGLYDVLKNEYINNLKNLNNQVINKLFAQRNRDLIKNNLINREKQLEDKYLVSAVVSVYNSDKYIRHCLNDLVGQTISDKVEILIIDSNSQQNEIDVIKEFQEENKNIKYFRSENRETVYSAWNRGSRLASGKYISNANTDDRHKDDAYELMSTELEKNLQVSLVYADVYETSKENITYEEAENEERKIWFDWNRELLLKRGCFIGPQPMWKKDIHDEYGYFDHTAVTSGDYDFWLRISQTNKFKHINQILGVYLKSPESIENTNSKKQREENKRYLKTYRDAYKEGIVVNRKKKLYSPSLDNDINLDFDKNLNTDIYNNVEFFIENKWNPNYEKNRTGYFILNQRWEYNSLDFDRPVDLNKNVDQIWVPSSFVKEAFINSGIDDNRVKVVPTGVDNEVFKKSDNKYNLKTDKNFKFLFVGTISDRKGLNILLDAYIEEFNNNDDVTLIINDDLVEVTPDFYDIYNKIKSIKENTSNPEIILLDNPCSENLDKKDFEPINLPDLYNSCDCFVYPFKTEAFGIHVLEAMSSGLPVITTKGGGILDFCNSENSLLINSEYIDTENNFLESYELIENMFEYNPDKKHLKELMRKAYSGNNLEPMIKNAKEKVISEYNWNKILEISESCLSELKDKSIVRFNINKIVEDILQKGLKAFDEKNYEKSEKSFYQLTLFDDSNSDYFYNLGVSQFMQEKFEDAIDSLSVSLDLGYCTYDLCNYLAQSLENIGDDETAQLYYEKANELK